MNREVIQADTTKWIKTIDKMDSVITSLPDKEETSFDSFKEWKNWFIDIVSEIIKKTKDYAIFYQTDRKTSGKIISKSYLLNKGNEKAGGSLMWHKIALRRDVGKIDLFRPSYTHFLCFSLNKTSGRAIPDVVNRGEMLYNNAMGMDVCKMCCEFIRKKSDTKTIYDPFCGYGSVLKVANDFNFNSVGIEILEDSCKIAKKL